MNGLPGRATRAEGGMTLIELLLAILVLAAVLGGLTTAFITVQHTASRTERQQVDRGQMMVSAAVVSQALRTAFIPPGREAAFEYAAGDRIRFYANLGGNPGGLPALVTVEAIESNGVHQLQMTTIRAALDGSGELEFDESAAQTRLLAPHVENPDELFSFHPAHDTDATLDPIPDNPGELRQIRAVTFTPAVGGADALRVNASQLSNRVRLPNLQQGSS